ncbi:MAG: FtsX-like permease family protein [Bacteroidetes bacterium]|nr:FtsX-like permease family protein [Bacteroidota bacterium]
MNFELKIASRYFLAKKSKNIINWITWISILVVSIVSAAIIIVLSALNGMNETVMNLYTNFDPDIKITAVEGKTFESSSALEKSIRKIPNVKYYVETVEENVLLKYDDNQEVAKLKGVSAEFAKMTQIEKMMPHNQNKDFLLEYGSQQFTVLSIQLAMKLGINTDNPHAFVNFYLPVFEEGSGIQTEYFKTISALPRNSFEINEDFGNYIIVNKAFANELLGYGNKISDIEIGITDPAKLEETKAELQKLLGNKFEVKTRFEQNSFLFKTLQTEKWITLFILAIITFLAIFNVIGSLYMLIIDKKKDVFILQSMGATTGQIKRIFWLESFIIGVVGVIIGLILGLALCVLQDMYGFIEIGANFSITAYPVSIEASDVIITLLLVTAVNALTSLIPVLAMKVEKP